MTDRPEARDRGPTSQNGMICRQAIPRESSVTEWLVRFEERCQSRSRRVTALVEGARWLRPPTKMMSLNPWKNSEEETEGQETRALDVGRLEAA